MRVNIDKSGLSVSLLLRVIPMLTIIVSLAGCLDTASTRIDGDNSKAAQPALRATINVNGAIRPAAEVRSGHAFEVGVQRTNFTSQQTLAAGAYPVYLDNVAFTSPNQLSNEFELTYLDALWRYRYFGGAPVGTEFVMGVASSTLGITITTPTQYASRELSNEGVVLGAGVIWRMNHTSSAHLRASYFLSFDTGIANAKRYELYYARGLTEHLALHAGYSYWEIKGTSDSDMSDFYLRFSGPALTLNYALTGGM